MAPLDKRYHLSYYSFMKLFDWNNEKNQLLKLERNIGFEDVMVCLKEDGLLDILEHYNKKKYGRQKIFVIAINHYVYLVPFVENEQTIFLKTIIPSRKATKKYLIDK